MPNPKSPQSQLAESDNDVPQSRRRCGPTTRAARCVVGVQGERLPTPSLNSWLHSSPIQCTTLSVTSSPSRPPHPFIEAARAGMLLAGFSIALVSAWVAFVRRTILGPLPTKLGAGLIASIVTVLVVQHAYRNPSSGARSMIGRGLATIAFAAAWGAVLVGIAGRFGESSRASAAIGIAVLFIVFGRWPRQTTSSAASLRFFQDPRGSSAFVVPLFASGALAITYISTSSSLRLAWRTMSESSLPVAHALGLLVGGSLALLIAAGFGTLNGRYHPAWLGFFATLPAMAASLIGAYFPCGPVPYPGSVRLEEQATSLAAEWWYGSQFTACGFYITTAMLLLAGLFSGLAASREGAHEGPRYRQTVIATLGPILVAACLGYTLYRLQSRIGRDERYELVFFPAALALVSLGVVHVAASAKVIGKYAISACVFTIFALTTFAVAQALPAGSNADVLTLAPFEWVLAAENIPPKQRFYFVPAISFVVPLGIASIIALRGASFSAKNILVPVAPGLIVLAAALGLTSQKGRAQQNHLATLFRAHLPKDVTLAAGPPRALTSCSDVQLESILFVGREQVTLNGQSIASTKDLDSPKVCADVAQRLKGKTPQLAMDESVTFRQTSCLLNAFSQLDPRTCNVVFVGRCKAGTHIAEEGVPACTEQMQNNVPLCSTRHLDVFGCRTSTEVETLAAMTRENIFQHGEYATFASNDWPSKPIDEYGQWNRVNSERWSLEVLGVAEDVPMRQLMALMLLPKYREYHLHPNPIVPEELPPPPKIETPLGALVKVKVTAEKEELGQPLQDALEKHKNELRRCLEPRELPWVFEFAVAHVLIERDGNIKSVWPRHHPNPSMGGCITKVLRDVRVAPIPEPRFMHVWMFARAILPYMTTDRRVVKVKVDVEPPNERIATQIGYWADSMRYTFGRNAMPINEDLNCIVPALLAHKKALGEIDFEITATFQQTRVRAKSKEVDPTMVACLEEHAQRRLEVYFKRHFGWLPQDYRYLDVTTPPKKITAEFLMTMYLGAPLESDP